MVLQNQFGLNKHQTYSHEQNYYSDGSHAQMMRPSGYCSTMPFSQPNHMMMGHGGHGHGQYGAHGPYGSHGHMPHDSTNFSSSAAMVHSEGGYGGGMQQSSHAHMSSMAMGHGYGGSHPSNYSYNQKLNWALKNMDD